MTTVRLTALAFLLIVLPVGAHADEKKTDVVQLDSGPDLADWPACRGDSDLNLEFSDTIHVNKHLFKKECDFIDRISIYRTP